MRIAAFPFAVGLICLGILLLLAPYVEGLSITLPIATLIILASLVLTYLFRFFVSGRGERGLVFLALIILSLGGLIALFSLSGDQLTVKEWWPLTLFSVAASLCLTFVVEREHERGLLGLAVLFMVAGIVALSVTLEIIPQNLIASVADYFPLVIAFIGITMIPLALRRPTG